MYPSIEYPDKLSTDKELPSAPVEKLRSLSEQFHAAQSNYSSQTQYSSDILTSLAEEDLAAIETDEEYSDSDSDSNIIINCPTTVLKPSALETFYSLDSADDTKQADELNDIVDPWAEIDKINNAHTLVKQCGAFEHPIAKAATEAHNCNHEFRLSADDIWHVFHSTLFGAYKIPPLSAASSRVTKINRTISLLGDSKQYSELLTMIKSIPEDASVPKVAKIYCKLILEPLIAELIEIVVSAEESRPYTKDFAAAAIFYDSRATVSCLSGWIFDLAPKCLGYKAVTPKTKILIHTGRIDAQHEKRPLFYSPTFSSSQWPYLYMEKRGICKSEGIVTLVS